MLAWARQFNLSESTFVTSLGTAPRATRTCGSSRPGTRCPSPGTRRWAPRRSSPTLGGGARRGAPHACRPGASRSRASDGGWRLTAPAGDPARGGRRAVPTSRPRSGIDAAALVRSDALLGRRRGRAARRAARQRRGRPRLRPRRAPDGRAHDVARSPAARLRLGVDRADDASRPGSSTPRARRSSRTPPPDRRAPTSVAGSSRRAPATCRSTSARAPRWAARRGCSSTSTTGAASTSADASRPSVAAPARSRASGADHGHLHRLPPRRQRRHSAGEDGAPASAPVRQRVRRRRDAHPERQRAASHLDAQRGEGRGVAARASSATSSASTCRSSSALPPQLRRTAADADAVDSPLGADARRYVTFMTGGIGADGRAALEAWAEPGERVVVLGSDVLLFLTKPAHQAEADQRAARAPDRRDRHRPRHQGRARPRREVGCADGCPGPTDRHEPRRRRAGVRGPA